MFVRNLTATTKQTVFYISKRTTKTKHFLNKNYFICTSHPDKNSSIVFKKNNNQKNAESQTNELSINRRRNFLSKKYNLRKYICLNVGAGNHFLRKITFLCMYTNNFRSIVFLIFISDFQSLNTIEFNVYNMLFSHKCTHMPFALYLNTFHTFLNNFIILPHNFRRHKLFSFIFIATQLKRL